MIRTFKFIILNIMYLQIVGKSTYVDITKIIYLRSWPNEYPMKADDEWKRNIQYGTLLSITYVLYLRIFCSYFRLRWSREIIGVRCEICHSCAALCTQIWKLSEYACIRFSPITFRSWSYQFSNTVPGTVPVLVP